MFVEYSRLQSGVGDTVGVELVVGEAVVVGVSDGVGGGGGGAGKGGARRVAGRPPTRAVRNCSMIPSRLATRCSCGQTELMIGTISGCSKSIVTETRSPGPPGCSNGSHSAGWKVASSA